MILGFIGAVYGGAVAEGLIVGIDHLGHSGKTLGPVGALLLGLGFAGLGFLIGKGADR